MYNYILDENHNLVECPDLIKWARWFEVSHSKRIVKQETIGEYWISTVFLGIGPQLFETMVEKNGKWLDYQERYATWKEAEEGHTLACYAAETNPKFLETGEIDV